MKKANKGIWTLVVAALFVMAPAAKADHAVVTGPGAIPVFDRMSAWANQAILVLQDAQQFARVSLSRGDYTGAKLALEQGLQYAQAGEAELRQNGPLTATALDRGVVLANLLDQATAGDRLGDRTVSYFLFNYYDFVLDLVNHLDLPLYIPYKNTRSRGSVDMEAYEARFVEYAVRQVELVLNKLADEGRMVTPVGAPAVFLNALEAMTAYAAVDLRSSLWAVRYACAISRLAMLSTRLHQFNTKSGGAASGYFNEVEAVNRSYYEASYILNNIRVGYGCMQ